jgi:glucokinase
MHYAIGVDVGGTKIAAAIVELSTGQLLHRREVATRRERGGAAILESVLTLSNELRLVAQGDGLLIDSVGVGICEIVGLDGQLRSATLIDWQSVDVVSTPAGLPPIHLVSDVRAAAVAESRFGAARDVRDAIYVSVGTGIASVLLIEGRPYAGAHGAALVLASAARVPSGDGSTAILEELASGPALVRQFGGAGGDSRMVIAAAHNGDVRALSIVAHATSLLGAAIAQLANCLDPAVIVIGGGLGSAPGVYFETLKSRIEEGIWRGVVRQIEVRPAALGADAGIVGAAISGGLWQR